MKKETLYLAVIMGITFTIGFIFGAITLFFFVLGAQ